MNINKREIVYVNVKNIRKQIGDLFKDLPALPKILKILSSSLAIFGTYIRCIAAICSMGAMGLNACGKPVH